MLITLLTDFGTRDYFVGAMKGVILSRDPRIRIVDLTHEVPPHAVPTAAFLLLALYREFPPGTVHVNVVDPGVGSDRRVIVTRAAGQYFVGPDNGTISYVLDREPGARTWCVQDASCFRHPLSTTFHGRDIFAPVGAAVATGTDPASIGSEIGDPRRLPSIGVAGHAGAERQGRILHIDRFGNCVTDITPADVPDGVSPSAPLRIGGHTISRVRRYFAEAAGDEVFAILGSAGFFELAVKHGSAAAALNVNCGDAVYIGRGA